MLQSCDGPTQQTDRRVQRTAGQGKKREVNTKVSRYILIEKWKCICCKVGG